MKHFKKLVAVLLAGVMMLTLFTACGGTVENTPQEKEMLEQINQNRAGEPELTDTLHSNAAAALKNIREDGKIRLEKAVQIMPVGIGVDLSDGLSLDMDIQITYVFMEGFSALRSDLSNVTIDMKAMPYGPQIEEQITMLKPIVPSIEKIGVASCTIGDSTYVAMTIQIKVSSLVNSAVDGLLKNLITILRSYAEIKS